MIRLLDERFRLNMGNAEMEHYAVQLGADCPFFINAEPAYATGIGEELEPADDADGNLDGYWLAIVRPDIAVSTAEAYKAITPREPENNCRMVVRQPIDTWRDNLRNDFEEPVFKMHPELQAVKEQLYDMGALRTDVGKWIGSLWNLQGCSRGSGRDLRGNVYSRRETLAKNIRH